jgi:type IV secretion system protein VirB1
VATSSPPAEIVPRKLGHREVLDLAGRCAPAEPAKVLASIVRVESAGHPLRIGVNGPRRAFLDPATPDEAVRLASGLIAAGKNIDLGLAQINARNLAWLGLSVEEAFEPCRNLAAAGVVMGRGYAAALQISRPGQSILQTAYSLYNTGDPDRGLSNGYVAKLEAARARVR